MSRFGRKELFAFLFLSTIWSGNWLVIRIGLRDLPPLRFAGMRMVLACLLLLPLALRARLRPADREAGWIAVVGLLQLGISYGCVYTAEQWIDSGLAALIFSTFPIWVGILGHFRLRDEPMTLKTAAAAVLGVSGVAVLQAPAIARAGSVDARHLLIGTGLVITGAVASAVASISVKKHLSAVSPPMSVFGQAVVAAVFLLSLSALFERGLPWRWTPPSIAALAYLGIVGTMTFIGSQWLVARVPVPVIGAFPLLSTVLAITWGVAFGREGFSARTAAGAALILTGVVLAVSAQAGRAGRPATPPAPARTS
ncbi:MAG: EamA family transporter [Acidobacteriota bacterium]|nr:EamA family transporter [Acidobacteriota bacterium]